MTRVEESRSSEAKDQQRQPQSAAATSKRRSLYRLVAFRFRPDPRDVLLDSGFRMDHARLTRWARRSAALSRGHRVPS